MTDDARVAYLNHPGVLVYHPWASPNAVIEENTVPQEESGSAPRKPAAQELLAAIVASSDDAIISKTLDGIITSWNVGAQRIFGYTPEEAIGKHINILIPEGRLDEEQEILSRLRRGERIEHFDTVRRAKDGHLIDVSLTVSPVRDGTGTVVGASKVARDVGIRREAERGRAAQALLAAIVESSDDAIVSKTLKGIITSWNRGAQNLFGYTPEEAIGQSVTMLIPGDRQDEETIILTRIGRGERIEHYETVRKAKNGRLIAVSLTISPIVDERGRVTGASKIARDISHQKEIQRKLEEADTRKDEFLALLAHELRNPLGPIRHAVKILGSKNPSPADVRWATEIIDRQTEHMTRLVEDLLDVARITRGTIELRRDNVDIADVLKGAVESSSALIDKHHHRLKVTLPSRPLYVDGDLTRLTQIVSNLLDNAAKYTDPGGRITVSGEREGDAAVIHVRDTGIGIAPELLPKIFDMFTQAGAGIERSQGGLGVGLSLVERLVKLHGGTVSAHSGGVGKGSEFTIRLPVASRAQKTIPLEGVTFGEKDKAAIKCRILVVDDNEDSAESLGMLLRMMGHEVETASEGEQGIASAAKLRPDIAILDIGMPKMNGYELAQKIREQPWAKDIVLIALTGWGQDEHRRRSAQSGFHHHLTKPVDFEALQKILTATESSLPERRLIAR